MPASVRILSGADSIRGAEAYREAVQDRRDSWPYVHVYPPPSATDVNVIGTVSVQSQGAQAVAVVTYTVNSGKVFYLQAVVLGANVSIIPGDALFTVDRNSAIGASNTQFNPEQGLINIPLQLGSFVSRPWRLHRAREFAANDVIRIKAVNVNLPEGENSFYACGLFGYEVPTLDVKAKR